MKKEILGQLACCCTYRTNSVSSTASGSSSSFSSSLSSPAASPPSGTHQSTSIHQSYLDPCVGSCFGNLGTIFSLQILVFISFKCWVRLNTGTYCVGKIGKIKIEKCFLFKNSVLYYSQCCGSGPKIICRILIRILNF